MQHRVLTTLLVLLTAAACERPSVPEEAPLAPTAPLRSAGGGGSAGALVVNVSNDTTAQNETPLAVNPRNAKNFIVGANDWNYNDGCAVNASLDGGKSWTSTLPNGFLPGVTKYTNDPAVAGTGPYDYGGDPAVAFGPDGTAYFACFGYQAAPPYNVALLISRSTDGGRTWQKGGSTDPLVQVTVWQGNGISKGSTGQFPDHEQMHVAADGTIYVTWAQFNGQGSHSPVYVATSRDSGRTFSPARKVTSGSIRSDQDQRIVSDPKTPGVAYLTFDNSIQGGKGTAMFASMSRDYGASWTPPAPIATFQNPVCLFPPYCFNISGTPFRGPGSYPAPAFDPVRNRLYVAYTDIVNGRAQGFLTYADAKDVTKWNAPAIIAPIMAGDRLNVELSVQQATGRLDAMFYDRGWSGNVSVDVTYVSSSDGGSSWTTKRVTPSSFNPWEYGVPSGAGVRPFIGDYTGIVSLPTGAAMSWTGPGRTYGTLPTNLEIYFGSATP